MTNLSLSLLGPFRASLGLDRLTDFRTRKVQALLIYLATEPGAHSRDQLLTLLWPGMPEKSARSNLRQVLYYLRQALPQMSGGDGEEVSVIVANRQEIRLHRQAPVTMDTWQFEALLEEVHAHDHLDLFLCPECATKLQEVVVLYRGDFLSDFYLDDSNEFEEWAQARREYFRVKALDAVGTLTTIALRRQDYGGAQGYAERQLEIDNMRESAYRQLMEALARSGRCEQALAAYERCRRVLAEELGMAPASRTSEVYEKIRAGDLRFDRSPTHRVRGYELKEPIGEGAYGVIHRAVQPAIRREVAVKVIRRKYADDPEFIRRFEAEAQMVARLEHPYIVPLYDYWRDPEGAYLVMRYLRGGSLLSKLKDGPWDSERTVAMLEQLAGSLATAHRQGIVHRDIKPGNILLDEAGNTYLADFGIARDLAGEKRLTAEGSVVGTLDYVSPEQILSENVTPQTDIYSLGAVLYETLAGEKPFGDATVAQLLYNHLHEPIPLVAASRPDISPAVDTVLQKATAKEPAGRYATVLEMAAAFRNAVRSHSPELSLQGEQPTPTVVDVYNPYKGLHAFQEADADDFFGRDALVQQLLKRLGTPANGQESRFLALVGPSGSGKSSVVKAGLIPALREGALPGSDRWFITEMVPGSNPLEELELALWRVAVDPPPDLVAPMQRDTNGILRTIRRILPADTAPQQADAQLLLVIDQFEELFTLVDGGQRAFFLDSILVALAAPRSTLRVLVTLRADFYDRPLHHPEWGQLLKQSTEVVLPLNRTELTWAIREPARRMGVALEEGLAATIVADVAAEPGALPLLQYVMTELFERREGNLITRAAYEQLGGVRAALGRRAEAVYAALDRSDQQATRQLFLRLITLGEGVEDTRRRVLRSELEALDTGVRAEEREQSAVGEVLDCFGAARFLTFDHDPLSRAPTVEVAHEALIRQWPRLRTWLGESRDDVRLQRLLAQATGEWLSADRDPGFLLRDGRLQQFASWAETTPVALTDTEHAYIATSLTAREERDAAEEVRRRQELETAQRLAATERRRAEEQASAAQRLRRRALYLIGLLLVAVVLAAAATWFAQLANSKQADALASAERAATSEAQALANADLAATRQVEAEVGAGLALAARSTAETEALVRATAEAGAVAERETAEQQRMLAEEQARLATSRELSLAALNSLDLDPELSILLALQALENAETKEAQQALHRALQGSRVRLSFSGHEGQVSELAYSPDGHHLTTLDDVSARLWDAATGAALQSLTFSGHEIYGPTYDPNGTTMAVVSRDESWQRLMINAWDVQSGTPALSLTMPITTDKWSAVSLNPDWSLLAVGYENGQAALWDVQTAEPLLTFPAHDDWLWDANFTKDGTRLQLGSPSGEISIWDLSASLAGARPQPVVAFRSLAATDGASQTASTLSEDGTQLALGFSGGLVEVWDLSSPTEPKFTLSGSQRNIIMRLAFSADGSFLAAASPDGTAAVWEMSQGRHLFSLAGHAGGLRDIAFSPDGAMLATAGSDGTARIWDATPLAGGELRHFATEQAPRDLELSPNGDKLALGGFAGPAVLLDAETGERLATFRGEPKAVSELQTNPSDDSAVYSLAFHPGGHRLATVGEDNVIRVWNLETGEVLQAWTGHGEGESGGLFFGTIDVAYSPDGSRLATAGTDGVAKVWDANTGEELLALTGHTDGLHSLAYSPDGRWIATSSDEADTTVKVWDATTGAEVYSLEGHPVRAWALAFSPDSRLLATGGFQGVVKVWDLETGAEQYTLPSQVNTVLSIRFTPDGRRMITGGDALRVWDVASGTELLTLSDTRRFFDLSADGTTLYTADLPSGVVRVYLLRLPDTVQLAHERLTRWWTPEECLRFLHQEECPAEPRIPSVTSP